jgi:hypothetical protein
MRIWDRKNSDPGWKNFGTGLTSRIRNTLTLENQIFLYNILFYFSRAYTDRQRDLTAELAERTLRLNPASCRVAALDPDQKNISIGRTGT